MTDDPIVVRERYASLVRIVDSGIAIYRRESFPTYADAINDANVVAAKYAGDGRVYMAEAELL